MVGVCRLLTMQLRSSLDWTFLKSRIFLTGSSLSTFTISDTMIYCSQFCRSFSAPAPSNSLQITDTIDEEEETEILTLDNIKTIKEIKENNKAGYFYTYGRIVNLECSSGWYYNSCNRCRSKALKNEQGRWMCTRIGCDGNITGYNSSEPRFQVKFLVSDVGVEKIHFMGFDSQIREFIDPSAEQLRDRLEAEGEQDSIPDEFEYFINKNFVFKIHVIERYNIKQESHSYTITRMSDDPKMMDSWMVKCNDRVKRDMTMLKNSTEQIATITQSAKKQLENLKARATKETEEGALSNILTPINVVFDTISHASTSNFTQKKSTIPALSFNLEDVLSVDAESSTRPNEGRKKEKST